MGGRDRGRKCFGGKEEEELAQGLSGAGMEHSFLDLCSVKLSYLWILRKFVFGREE